MEEFEENLDVVATLAEELTALLPEEPTTELEAKVAEFLGRVVQHMALLEAALGAARSAPDEMEDDEVVDLYNKMSKEGDKAKVRTMMRRYEKIVMDEQAYTSHALWWYKINPYRSYVKGWKIAPSHYLNQQLDNVWLEK